MLMDFVVMGAAEPPDFQWFGIVVVMALYLCLAAHFARKAFQEAALHGQRNDASHDMFLTHNRIGSSGATIPTHVSVGFRFNLGMLFRVALYVNPPLSDVPFLRAGLTDILDAVRSTRILIKFVQVFPFVTVRTKARLPNRSEIFLFGSDTSTASPFFMTATNATTALMRQPVTSLSILSKCGRREEVLASVAEQFAILIDWIFVRHKEKYTLAINNMQGVS